MEFLTFLCYDFYMLKYQFRICNVQKIIRNFYLLKELKLTKTLDEWEQIEMELRTK